MSVPPTSMDDVHNRLLEGDNWRAKADVTFAKQGQILENIATRLDAMAEDYKDAQANRRDGTRNLVTWVLGAVLAMGGGAVWVITAQVTQQVEPLTARMGASEARAASIEATLDRVQDTANVIRSQRDAELRSDDNRISRLEYFNELLSQGRLRLPSQP